MLQVLTQASRSRRVRTALCVVLLLCIAALVLVPGANVAPARVRVFRAASWLLMQLGVLALGFAVRLDIYQLLFELLSSLHATSRPSTSRLFLTHVLLC
jgi:hypothetical protein